LRIAGRNTSTATKTPRSPNKLYAPFGIFIL
jgi:hypothetical protein